MSEDSKYYVLTIEDIDFGLEYEERIEGEWISKVCDLSITTPNIINLDTDIGKYYYIKHNDYRVKHLDREDIEGFGFEAMSTAVDAGWFVYNMVKNGANIHLSHSLIFRSVAIQVRIDGMLDKDIGHLRIKNKSELGRVLRQVGVIV